MEWKFNLDESEYLQCKQFAEESSKTQREHRSGGTIIRPLYNIFSDTFRGKVGELIVKKFLEQEPLMIQGIKLDFGIYPRGVWDSCDFSLNGVKVSIKSSKSFAKWLLLETKDIDREDVYDYYILVLISQDYKSGVVKGFANKDEIIGASKISILLNKGDFIPGTQTPLDASNYALKSSDLHNTENEWGNFKKIISEQKK